MSKHRIVFDVELTDGVTPEAKDFALADILHELHFALRETWGPDNPDSDEAPMRYDGYQGPFLVDAVGRVE